MRSRLAIIAMLVFGMLLSTGGGALAVSGFASQQDNAAQSQYGGVQGEEDEGDQGDPRRGGLRRRCPLQPLRGQRHPARAPGRGRRPGHRRRGAAALHRLRRDPDPARRRRAADDRLHPAPAQRRRRVVHSRQPREELPSSRGIAHIWCSDAAGRSRHRLRRLRRLGHRAVDQPAAPDGAAGGVATACCSSSRWACAARSWPAVTCAGCAAAPARPAPPRPVDGAARALAARLPLHGRPWMRRLNAALLRRQVRRAVRRLGLARPVLWSYVPAGRGARRHAATRRASSTTASTTSPPRRASTRRRSAPPRRASRAARRPRARLARRRSPSGCARSTAHVARRPQRGRHRAVRDRAGAGAGRRRARRAAAPAHRLHRRGGRDQGRPRAARAGSPRAPGLEHRARRPRRRSATRSTDVSALRELPNVHLLGAAPLRATCRRCCAARTRRSIPYAVNELTRSVFPMKVYEYLAAGLPVVSTPLPALAGVEDIAFAADARQMAAALDTALETDDPPARRARWSAPVGTRGSAGLTEIGPGAVTTLVVTSYTPGAGAAAAACGPTASSARSRCWARWPCSTGRSAVSRARSSSRSRARAASRRPPSLERGRALAMARGLLGGVPAPVARGVLPSLAAEAARLAAGLAGRGRRTRWRPSPWSPLARGGRSSTARRTSSRRSARTGLAAAGRALRAAPADASRSPGCRSPADIDGARGARRRAPRCG